MDSFAISVQAFAKLISLSNVHTVPPGPMYFTLGAVPGQRPNLMTAASLPGLHVEQQIAQCRRPASSTTMCPSSSGLAMEPSRVCECPPRMSPTFRVLLIYGDELVLDLPCSGINKIMPFTTYLYIRCGLIGPFISRHTFKKMLIRISTGGGGAFPYLWEQGPLSPWSWACDCDSIRHRPSRFRMQWRCCARCIVACACPCLLGRALMRL